MRMVGILMLGLIGVLPAWGQNTTWKLDSVQSEFVVKVWKAGAAAGLAHDHVIRASKYEGEVTLENAAKPESFRVAVTVEVASLIPDEPRLRRKHSVIGPDISEGDRKKVADSMLGRDQLDAPKFPSITFKSTRVARSEGGAFLCAGNLTLHGQTREIEFPCSIAATDKRVEGNAKVKLRISDFGIKPFSTALGLIQNKDEMELVIHLVAMQP